MTSLDSLPSVYAPQSIEPGVTEFWLAGGFFSPEPDDHPTERRFTIVIPPPNVTGALHLGHAINAVLQDVLVRWHRMRGFNTLWVPGTDHAGIATQAVVERRLVKDENLTNPRLELGRDELVKRIWNWKDEYEKRILGQMQRLGCSCDWNRTRFTLDERCAKAVQHTFHKWFTDGYIYRGTRLVNWDTQLQTAVSDDEVYHETVKTHFWHIRYPLIDPGPKDPKFVVVATTRPETMLGDTAVAVNPRDERYKDLIGKKLRLPLAEREISIIADEWADPEKGSGCVKITPAHDTNDHDVGKRHDLATINVFNPDGTIGVVMEPDGTLKPGLKQYIRKTRKEARRMIVADLDSLGLIDKIEEIETDVAHSDRSKTRIETLPSLQWFVRMDKLAQTAMDAVEDGRVKIHPARYARTYLDWLGEKRDWCVSRQLWWGHRIPIWYCEDCEHSNGNLLKTANEVAGETKGWTYHWLEGATPIVGPDADTDPTTCPDCGGSNLVQDPDVLDTWFSSQLWPHSTLGWPDETPELAYYYPTSVLITSRDIITLWVARMVLAGLYNCGEVPFSNVYIHCKILDGQGRTMSKSLGNGVDPLDIIEKYGCDALRYTMADMATETQDVRMPVQTEKLDDGRTINVSEKFEVGRNFCNKLWNAARFAFLNLEDVPHDVLDPERLPIEDRWILSQLSATARDVHRALSGYQFSRALNLLRDFFWDCLCDWYLELVKARVADDREAGPARQVLGCCLDQTLRLLHPFVPFITERLWRQLNEVVPRRGLPGRIECPHSAALVTSNFPPEEGWPGLIDGPLTETFEHLQAVTRGVRDVRMRHNISPRQALDVLVKPQPEFAEPMRRAAHVVQKLARIGKLTLDAQARRPKDSASVLVGSVQVFVLDCVEDASEQKRIEKDVAEVENLIAGKEKKLANAGFVERAPAEIVERERERLAELHSRRRHLNETLDVIRNG